MKKLSLICIMAWIIIFVLPSYAETKDDQKRPRLDCNKMVLDMIKSIEDRDFELYCRLFGREYSEERKIKFYKSFEKERAKEYFPFLLDNLRLFPKIEEIPEWTTCAKFYYEYVRGNMEIQTTALFVLKDDTWICIEFEPESYPLDEGKKTRVSRYISSPPAQGERTLDVGLNDIINKFLSDLEEDNLASIKQYTPYSYSDLKKKKSRRFRELLSQFPSIGPIPAPAKKFGVLLRGTSESRRVIIDVEFIWVYNSLRLFKVEAYRKK